MCNVINYKLEHIKGFLKLYENCILSRVKQTVYRRN